MRGDLITAYTFLKGGSGGGGADLPSLVTSDRNEAVSGEVWIGH